MTRNRVVCEENVGLASRRALAASSPHSPCSTASEVSQSTLRKDISRTLPAPSEATVAKLLELLERVFILETIQPWAVSLRSKARLRRSPKYQSADPALAAAALRAGTSRLSTDLATLGFLFESAAIHDLLVHTEALGGHLYHYRDSNGTRSTQ